MGDHSSQPEMEAFKGTYERTSAENYEEMLKILDVNMLLRKAACASTPKMEVSEDGGVWRIKTSTTLKTMELKFKLGEQFDETTPDGREVTAVVNLDGGKIVTVQKAKKDGEKSTKVAFMMMMIMIMMVYNSLFLNLICTKLSKTTKSESTEIDGNSTPSLYLYLYHSLCER